MGIGEEDRDKLTFKVGTTYYRFKRLPFGVKLVSSHIQKHLSHHLEDMNVRVYVDDIVIHGKTRREHDAALIKVCGKLKELGLRVNLGKCHFGKIK